MNMNDNEIRQALTEKFLNAETSPGEEKMLMERLLSAEEKTEEELAVLRLMQIESLSDGKMEAESVYDDAEAHENSKTFDRMTGRRTKRRILITVCGSVAAAIAAILMLHPSSKQAPAQENPFTAIEIAQTLQDMMDLKMEEVESINATPVEEKILVKVQLTDGSSEMYLMTKDSDTGSITLLAFNN